MGIKLGENLTNVKTVSHCPQCGRKGEVLDQHKNMVLMRCPECHNKWKTYSKNCPKCGKPNGFAVDGLCGSCYSKYFSSH